MGAKRITVNSVDIEDKPGNLQKFLNKAASAGIDLFCLAAFSVGRGKGRIYLSAKNQRAFEEFTKRSRIKTKAAAGFIISDDDEVGAAARALQTMSKAKINGLVGTAMAADGQFHMLLVVDPDDADAAQKALTA